MYKKNYLLFCEKWFKKYNLQKIKLLINILKNQEYSRIFI